MVSLMVRPRHHFQVLDAVVVLVVILVMHEIARQKEPAEMDLHHQTVLRDKTLRVCVRMARTALQNVRRAWLRGCIRIAARNGV
jgi:hypothetical protein